MIFDFDGTLTALEINWSELRSELNVSSLRDIWFTHHSTAWKLVTEAEVLAVQTSPINQDLLGLLKNRFVILSNNSERAISEFFKIRLNGFPLNPDHLIIGRETLRGPKEDQEIFTTAIHHAVEFLHHQPGTISYFGDRDYELDFARRLGLKATHVSFLAIT